MPHLRPSIDRRIASNKTPRRINSSVVLNTVRKRQPISRVDLARVSGLQPSTVSLIVEDLLASGWLLEGEAVKGAMGRRPRLLSISNERRVIAVDIHPQQSCLAVVDISGRIVWQKELNLPKDPAKAISRLATALKETVRIHKDCTFEGIGICLPGRTHPNAEELIFAPNLRWPITSLKSRIERATGLRVEMDNVANACALLEVWLAEGDQVQDLAVVEISEGIGTGLFVNGAIARGRGGMAGEFGHIQMVEDGPPCNCGRRGCWETLASNQATVRYYKEEPRSTRNADFSKVLKLALAGDPPASAALRRTAMHLGRGLQMVAAALAPTEIIIVGDIATAWEAIGNIVEQQLRKHPLAQSVKVRPAHDSETARLRSAVALVLAERFTRE